ncbi:MAG: c-type cytochrome [Cellvibrionaceae bacterium]|nr:c-type cytochrome [Cellvibrionaceae bacterium]
MRIVKVKKFVLNIVCISSALGLAAPVLAEAPKSEARCRACHGVGGAAPIADNYPKLSGQNKSYLIESLKSYKADKRSGSMAGIMAAQAKMLSDAEIEALAAYYAAQK